jgi:prolyl-tRNA editing enzyme YbaK/EbsC (Cys-tRNA(Pro) deacylase)
VSSHPNVQKVADALAAAGATGEIVILDEAVPTAAAAAAELGCEVGAIANSLIFDGDGAPVLILTSGAHRVDTAKVAAELGIAKLKRAAPEFVKEHTGQSIGGVAPVGHPAPLPAAIDASLARFPTVYAAAGHPFCVFATTLTELARLTSGTVSDRLGAP